MVDPRMPDAQKVAALREALPAAGAGIYLDTATRGPLPAETAAAMREADDWELRVGRAAAGREEDAEQRADEARAVLAALITGQPDEIALLPGVEIGLSIAAWAPDWHAGDHALTTSLDDPRVRAALAAVQDRLGVAIDVVDLPDATDADRLLAALEGAMTERTRLIAISAVMPGTGLQVPLAEVARLARHNDAMLAVDASAAVGAVALAAPDLDADFVAFATDAWCLGPEGTAAVWVGPRARAEARSPFSGSATAGRSEAARFEPLALPRTALLGLARSVGWLEMYVELEWAFERAGELARRAHAALAGVPGVEVLTPAAAMATIVTFRVAGWRAEDVADELGRRVFAIMPPLPELNALRASVAWFNTEDELERLVETVALIAAHTPATLPRRPSLIVMPNAGGGQ
jgi:selenocysteine lyase/cysteine desulfurase